VLVVTHEYVFYLPLSERLHPPARRKARRLLFGSYTPGTMGRRLRPINLNAIGSLQRQMAREPHTSYQIWPHHSWLKRRGHQPKKSKNLGPIHTVPLSLLMIDLGRQDSTTSLPGPPPSFTWDRFDLPVTPPRSFHNLIDFVPDVGVSKSGTIYCLA
jgi:hypothetical protein